MWWMAGGGWRVAGGGANTMVHVRVVGCESVPNERGLAGPAPLMRAHGRAGLNDHDRRTGTRTILAHPPMWLTGGTSGSATTSNSGGASQATSPLRDQLLIQSVFELLNRPPH